MCPDFSQVYWRGVVGGGVGKSLHNFKINIIKTEVAFWLFPIERNTVPIVIMHTFLQ